METGTDIHYVDGSTWNVGRGTIHKGDALYDADSQAFKARQKCESATSLSTEPRTVILGDVFPKPSLAPGYGIAPPPPPPPPRRYSKADILDEAKATVAGRGKSYGRPEDNFERIAARWRVHLLNRFGLTVPIDAASVALMMDDMKSARLENDIHHADSWIDKAGYASCGGEIAAESVK